MTGVQTCALPICFPVTIRVHRDIGFNKFLDSFREEAGGWVNIDIINKHLSKYHAKLDPDCVKDGLVFESEAHFNWFVIKWSE